MSSIRTNRVLPTVLVVISAIWMASLVCPILYSVIFPSPQTRQLLRGLEGHGAIPRQLDPLARQAGLLRRAIPVKKYWHFSGDYSVGHSHTTVETELTYIAWFQNLPKPAVLVITDDSSNLHLDVTVYDHSAFTALWIYYVPVALLISSIFWFWKSRTLAHKESSGIPAQEAVETATPSEGVTN